MEKFRDIIFKEGSILRTYLHIRNQWCTWRLCLFPVSEICDITSCTKFCV